MHVLVLVLVRAVDHLSAAISLTHYTQHNATVATYLYLVVVDQYAARHGPLPLSVVLGGGEHREHSAEDIQHDVSGETTDAEAQNRTLRLSIWTRRMRVPRARG